MRIGYVPTVSLCTRSLNPLREIDSSWNHPVCIPRDDYRVVGATIDPEVSEWLSAKGTIEISHQCEISLPEPCPEPWLEARSLFVESVNNSRMRRKGLVRELTQEATWEVQE